MKNTWRHRIVRAALYVAFGMSFDCSLLVELMEYYCLCLSLGTDSTSKSKQRKLYNVSCAECKSILESIRLLLTKKLAIMMRIYATTVLMKSSQLIR